MRTLKIESHILPTAMNNDKTSFQVSDHAKNEGQPYFEAQNKKNKSNLTRAESALTAEK